MSTNGFTQKELLNLIISNQREIDKKLSLIHERINQRPTRMEIFGWLTITIASLGAIFNSIMS
tara:strand:+ start:221 stop:409 length:189 start_codon:yes stop_codon:yes gene_type:complete